MTTVAGLSSAKSRTKPSTSSSERSTRVRAGEVRGISSRNHAGSVGGRAVDEGRGLHDHLADRRARLAGGGQEVHGPDDVDLVQGPARHPGRVDDQEGVDDGVHLGGPDDARQDRVGLVGPDELGALEGDRRLAGAHAEDHLDLGIGLEGLGHAAAPEACRGR